MRTLWPILIIVTPLSLQIDNVTDSQPSVREVSFKPLEFHCSVFDLESSQPSKSIEGIGTRSRLYSFRENEVTGATKIDRCAGAKAGAENLKVVLRVQLRKLEPSGLDAHADLKFEVYRFGESFAKLEKGVVISKSERGVYLFLSGDRRKLFVFRWHVVDEGKQPSSGEHTVRGALITLGKALPDYRSHYSLGRDGEKRIRTCVSWNNIGLSLKSGENGGLGLPISRVAKESTLAGLAVPDVLTYFRVEIMSNGFPSTMNVQYETAQKSQLSSAIRVNGRVEFVESDSLTVMRGESDEYYLVVLLDND